MTVSSVWMTKVLQSYIIPKQSRWIFEELSLREYQTELFYYFLDNSKAIFFYSNRQIYKMDGMAESPFR